MSARHIVVVPYDEKWTHDFASIRAALAHALGDIALAIEHVGSTSVVGVWAKPIIDIDVVIESYDMLNAAIERLSAIGYTHNGD